jgi:hypothetical protein
MRRIHTILVITGLCLLLAVGCTPDSEENKVLTAAQEYAQTQSDVPVTLKIAEIDGSYARVDVTPTDPDAADEAVMFLRKKKNGDWEGLALGSAFSPDDYAAFNIPESIQE